MDYSGLTVAQLRDILRGRDTISISKFKTKEQLIQRLQTLDENDKRIAEMRAREEAQEAAHRLTRQLSLRIQDSVEDKIGCLEYPFSFLLSGEYPRECDPIPGQPEEEIGDFPNTVAEYLWIHEGENDEEPWLCLCKLENDVYVFYKGECDYTGFDCQGGMEIYASKVPAILIQYGMASADYEKYIQETHT
jgi:hypothetical protein